MEIIHGIYIHGFIPKCYTRYSFFKNLEDINFQIRSIEIPNELMETLRRKWKSWKNKLHSYRDLKVIEFTYGYTEKYAAITIVSPKDFFNRRIGYNIIKGRLTKGEKVFNYDKNFKHPKQHQIIEVSE